MIKQYKFSDSSISEHKKIYRAHLIEPIVQGTHDSDTIDRHLISLDNHYIDGIREQAFKEFDGLIDSQ